jgi:hypothetical protein
MSSAFRYKPKFVDIRVRPPSKEEEARAADVHALKPGERRCDHPDCLSPATARAPKSRSLMDQHYWFCQPHAAEYNRNWDFFAGMSEAEIRARQADSFVGDRPTWQFKASRFAREAASFAARAGTGGTDPFGLFAAARRREQMQAANERRLGKIERRALADLDLEAGVDAAAIRARYTELGRPLGGEQAATGDQGLSGPAQGRGGVSTDHNFPA